MSDYLLNAWITEICKLEIRKNGQALTSPDTAYTLALVVAKDGIAILTRMVPLHPI